MVDGDRSSSNHSPLQKQISTNQNRDQQPRAPGSFPSKRPELAHPNILERGPMEREISPRRTRSDLEEEEEEANIEQENYTRRVLWGRVNERIVRGAYIHKFTDPAYLHK
ncbi:hypothetical protein FRB91_008456 [Serendipita sp. 411]|nr:hypothetical protein FRB91_008456 [Serendipita sp. 411]